MRSGFSHPMKSAIGNRSQRFQPGWHSSTRYPGCDDAGCCSGGDHSSQRRIPPAPILTHEAKQFSGRRPMRNDRSNTHCIPANGVRPTPALSFLLPRKSWCGKQQRPPFRFPPRSVTGIFRIHNANLFAANQILDSSPGMIPAFIGDSKLFADYPRHIQARWLSAIGLHSTWQGGGNPLRCILPQCRKRHVETLPVSTPSGLRGAAAFPAWEMGR